MHFLQTVPIASLVSLAAAPAIAGDADWSKVADALGESGTKMPEGVYRIGMPSTDLHVTLEWVEIKPTLALESGLAFHATATRPWSWATSC